jgi:hypothetical protein
VRSVVAGRHRKVPDMHDGSDIHLTLRHWVHLARESHRVHAILRRPASRALTS